MTLAAAPRLLTALALLASWPAMAQGVHRIVGPDGRVTFSDQPPPATQARPPAAASSGAAPAGQAGSALPYELRQIAARFPVLLYTSADCAPCNSGRNLLNARGIPYTEKTIASGEDTEALRRLNSDASLPFLTIGGQKLRGYLETEWTQYLDAAGYPKQSALPPGYRRPAPAPLVPAKATPGTVTPSGTPGASTGSEPGAPAETPVQPPADNPAGIRF